mgnify:CR=1 FL=1
MATFLQNACIWTLALYGLFEIIKTLYCYFTYKTAKTDGIYIIIATKNQEKTIEGFLRGLMFNILYNDKNYKSKIILTDFNSTDKTKQILNKLIQDYDSIEYMDTLELLSWVEMVNQDAIF